MGFGSGIGRAEGTRNFTVLDGEAWDADVWFRCGGIRFERGRLESDALDERVSQRFNMKAMGLVVGKAYAPVISPLALIPPGLKRSAPGMLMG